MNRYTNISLSEFNPMTLQEKMIVPSIKRKQHDTILADQTAILEKLNKVQPHDKFFNEAQTLKKQITDKISSHASKLAKEGVNNNMISDTIALNREYNDLASETGKLGMINAHNLKAKDTEIAYMKQAKEMGQSPEAAQYWVREAMQKHMQDPLYDEKGRVIDFKVDRDVVKYEDRESKFHEFAKENKMMSGVSWDDIKSSFGTDKKTGATYVNETGRKGHNKNNFESLQKVADYMNSLVLDPNSNLYKSERYNRRDIQSALNANLSQAQMYRQSDVDSGSSSKISNVQYPDKPESTETNPSTLPYGTPDPKGTVVIGGGSVDLSDVEKIGKTNNFVTGSGAPVYALNLQDKTKGMSKKSFTVNDITDPVQRTLYEETFKQMKSPQGLLVKNKQGQTMTYKLGANENQNSAGVAKLVTNIIKNLPDLTHQRKIISTGSTMNNFGFVPNQNSKLSSELNSKMRDDLKSNQRQFITDDNQLVSWNDLPDLANVVSVKYDGYKSPIDLQPDKKDQVGGKMPHQVTLTLKGNKTITMGVTRIKGQDDRGINEDNLNQLNKNVLKAKVSSSLGNSSFQEFESNIQGMKGVKFRFIPPASNTSEGSYELQTKNGIVQMTEPEFISLANKTR